MSQIVGRRVVALVGFPDTDSVGRAYVHAIAGELGSVVGVYDELTAAVRWDRTGTICDCAHDEIQILSRAVIPRG